MNGRDADRFWSYVDRTSECWLWLGGRTPNGYGKFWLNGGTALAHRVAYKTTKGPIPEGLHIDHLCRVPLCVRPDHLEPVTPQVNTLRGIGPASRNARKTHCPQGHPYSEANTGVQRYAGRVARVCLTCGRERQKRYAIRKALRAAGVAA